MKLFGLYLLSDIPNLEKNHRKFAEMNSLSYQKFSIRNFYEKWALVYHLLHKHADEILLFIDAFSYFASAKLPEDIPTPIFIQEANGRIMDNFFIVQSTQETRRIFNEILRFSQQQFLNGSHSFQTAFKEGIAKSYDYATLQGIHLNVDPAFAPNGRYFRYFGVSEMPIGFDHRGDSPSGSIDLADILVTTYGGYSWDSFFWSAAEILCHHRAELPEFSENPSFEVFNPGKKRALLTLTSMESGIPTPDYALVSDRNFRRYGELNGITVYFYRGIPEAYKGLHSTWTKPYLALRHLDQHEYLSWVDADILLSPEFELPSGGDVIVYSDPGAWLFNAGFMTFKNSPKSISYLQSVIARCEAITDRSSLYINGSDQTQFIEEFKAHFPDILPRSNMEANTPVVFKSPFLNIPGLWHFMGLNPPSLRAIVMDCYAKRLENCDLGDFSENLCASTAM
jgi:hypothetical protein